VRKLRGQENDARRPRVDLLVSSRIRGWNCGSLHCLFRAADELDARSAGARLLEAVTRVRKAGSEGCARAVK